MKAIAIILALIFIAAAWAKLGLLALLIVPFAGLFLLMALAPLLVEELNDMSNKSILE